MIRTLNQAAKSSMPVMSTCAIIGFSGIVTAVPGYSLLLKGLEKASGGNPYIFAFICVAVTTVLNTTLATVIAIVFAMIGIR